MDETPFYQCTECGNVGTIDDFDVAGADGANWFCQVCHKEDEMPEVEPLTFGYTNHRGEYDVRRAVPVRVGFTATEHHPEPQWIMTAYDCDRRAERSFAMKDMTPTYALPPETLAKMQAGAASLLRDLVPASVPDGEIVTISRGHVPVAVIDAGAYRSLVDTASLPSAGPATRRVLETLASSWKDPALKACEMTGYRFPGGWIYAEDVAAAIREMEAER